MARAVNSIRGLIFDLDGTLVDSGLDFDALRREMKLPPGQPILESLAQMTDPRRQECLQILKRHEWAGAARARLMPGVGAFVDEVARRGLRRAVLTRNSRDVTLHTLERLELEFDPVLAREDGPVKPDPAAIWAIRDTWELASGEIAIIGDFRFDIEAGRDAGVRTIWYARHREPDHLDGIARPDFVLHSFDEAEALWTWMAEPV